MEPEPEPDNEVAEVRPIFKNVTTKCLTCHKELNIRRPTKEEQVSVLNDLRIKWNLNVTKPEDIYLVGDPCSCGQEKQAYFEIGIEKLK